ncbi:MAG TPA: hypothetical protein VJS92_02595, partial [Candidatus Polarisedimenticolaceae bacterium]|nr:hypothetical protein [Candidatus Polarisedimenticolaceae bacterium]
MIALATLLLLAAGDVLAPVTGSAQQDLDRSLAELEQLRARVAAERVPLARQVGELEQRLGALRHQSEDAGRSQDTRTLDINNLKEANRLRGDELTYVANLIDEYARGFSGALHVGEATRWSGPL